MYRYALSPLADRLASLLPRTVAPNLITVLGLVPTISGHLLVLFYCPDFQQPVPSWVWAYVAFCTFAYQTIDNMDGKQARRTGTSSPLGMLIDHGVDALNVTFTGMNLIALFQFGGDWLRATLIWLGGALPFFFLTWEEFYTGILYLPIVNGPTDGVLILVLVFLVSASVEDYTKFWSLPVPGGGGASITDCVLLFFWLCVFGNIAASFFTVERFHHGGGRGGSHGGSGATPPSAAGARPAATQRRRFRDAVAALVPFFAGAAASALWMSRSRVYETHPRCVFWLLGLVFSKLVTHLQVAHICGEAYRPWRKTLILPLLLITANKAFFRSPPVEEAVLLVGCVGAAFLAWFHMFCSVVAEMAAALEIRVFSLQPPKKAQ